MICDQALSYIAWAHSKDQSDYYNSRNGVARGTYIYNDNCNFHSWLMNDKHQCCYSGDHSNKECMYDALKKVTGNDYGIYPIYEVHTIFFFCPYINNF